MAQVEDPSKYGVVVMDDACHVERFVEKPKVGLIAFCMLGFDFASQGSHESYHRLACFMPPVTAGLYSLETSQADESPLRESHAPFVAQHSWSACPHLCQPDIVWQARAAP